MLVNTWHAGEEAGSAIAVMPLEYTCVDAFAWTRA